MRKKINFWLVAALAVATLLLSCAWDTSDFKCDGTKYTLTDMGPYQTHDYRYVNFNYTFTLSSTDPNKRIIKRFDFFDYMMAPALAKNAQNYNCYVVRNFESYALALNLKKYAEEVKETFNKNFAPFRLEYLKIDTVYMHPDQALAEINHNLNRFEHLK